MKTHITTVAVAAIIAVAGIAGVNLYHHLELPTLNKDKVHSSYFWNLKPPFIHTKYDIRLSDEIQAPQDYFDIGHIIQDQAKSGDKITFHLAGYGGQVQGLNYLYSVIKDSKAPIEMRVEAPVYSAHAYLALMGSSLHVSQSAFLMFHYSSVINLDCSNEKGEDRGVSNVEHCETYKAEGIKEAERMLNTAYLLTPQEKDQIRQGHDVYLDADEVKERTDANNSN